MVASLVQAPKVPSEFGKSTVPAFAPPASYPVRDTLPMSPRLKVKLPLTADPARMEPVALATVVPPPPEPSVVFGNDMLRPALEADGLVVRVPLTLVQPRPSANVVVPASSVKVPVVAKGCPTAIVAGAVAAL